MSGKTEIGGEELQEELIPKLIKQFKGYGKYEYCAEDEIITGLIEAARETLCDAGVSKDRTSPLYCLAVVRLAIHYYENPEEVGGSQLMPMGMNWMVEHLRLSDVT